MKSLFGLLVVLSVLTVPFSASADDWVSLFDGTSVENWTARGEVGTLEAKDGEIHLSSRKNVWVVTEREMADFEFTAEVLLPEDADEVSLNSGIAFRCTGDSGKPTGYQCEIEAPFPGETGGVFGIGLGGWLYPREGEKAEYRAAIEGVLKKGD